MTEAGAASESGVPSGEALLAFAEAAFGDDEAELARARSALEEAVGAEALVDAAAVVGNFQRMVRIADASGIPLDGPMDLITADLRSELGIDRFAGGAEHPTGPVRKFVARWLRPVGLLMLRLGSRRS